MLGWFADEADPDAGLLSFRRVSDELGSTHWYLKMLRDEGLAGRAPRPRAWPAAGMPPTSSCGRRSASRCSGTPNGLTPRAREALAATMRPAAGAARHRRRRDRVGAGASAVTSCSGSPSPTSPGTIDLRGVGRP